MSLHITFSLGIGLYTRWYAPRPKLLSEKTWYCSRIFSSMSWSCCGNGRYVTNQTSTRKYSWWSFLPRSLFEQYRRAAYWYFTAMAALSLAPFSPYNRFSVWLPLAFVLILGILRELWEDLRRYRGDNLVNSRPVLVHDGEGHLLEKQWKHLCVGDIVKVMDGDYFPADLLLLSSTGPEGICYVETMNLDGETNLKVKKLTPFFICGLHDCFILLLIER